MYNILAVLALFTLSYIFFAGRIERTSISGPMIFITFGLLIGPLGFDLISLEATPDLLRTLAELTLALVLFTDAAAADLGVLKRIQIGPTRMLAIGLPLSIALGVLAGWLLFPDWPILEVALLATILAPTDAALGKPVVANEKVPKSLRQALNVESGLNDGICVPILFLFLALITGISEEHSPFGLGLHLFIEEVGIGLLAATAVVGIVVVLAKRSQARGWLTPDWSTMMMVATAFACFGLAQWLGGSGFIASFVGGLMFGAWYTPAHKEQAESAEGIGNVFSLVTWVLFGGMVVSQLFGMLSWTHVGYALLSLTVVRMLPVFLSLLGLGVSTEEKLFLGWFGPRGLASIVFVVLVVIGDTPIQQGTSIALIVACTVTLSVLLHGISANPWANRIGRRYK